MAGARILHIVVAVIMFCGWAIYLAGVTNNNAICNKVGNGDLTATDLISSGPDSPDKNFLPLNDPWALPTATPSSNSASGNANNQAIQDAINQALQGRKLAWRHGRALLSVYQDRCGWTYSFAWWTVALQALATMLAWVVSIGALASARHAVMPLLAVSTALLCVIASDLIPIAANYNAIQVKGRWANAVYVTSAGIIITLVANFAHFLLPPVDVVGGSCTTGEVK